MNTPIISKKRDIWIDNVKVFACILVVLGHFFQSMTRTNIISASHIYEWFNTTIYYFHVPLFLICSGYLYQEYSKINDLNSWIKNIKKKAFALGVPYMAFSFITWLFKTLFSNDVNNQVGGLIDTLVFHPTAPYWYLYALFFIFFITPTFNQLKILNIWMVIALVVHFVPSYINVYYALSIVLTSEIWFILGMYISMVQFKPEGKTIIGKICGALFILLSIIIYKLNISNLIISFLLGILACFSTIILFANYNGKLKKGMKFLSEYTMPIFLMHTLFAATIRVILMHLKITNSCVHILLGLIVSIFGPIIVAKIMNKTKILDFLIYPNNLIKL